MCLEVSISGRKISSSMPPYIVAELSGNHNQSISTAKKLIKAAAKAGADAVKIQIYHPDTITLPFKNKYFKIKKGPWAGKYLHDNYSIGMTPWEWVPKLEKYADELGVCLFSSVFDETSVDYLEEASKSPAYKIASFEINHIPLLKRIGKTKKPVILSTGMATEEEIKRALKALRNSGSKDIIVLKCISNYPADPKDFNLRSIESLRKKTKCLIGLSDHSMTNEVCIGAVALGACFIEKHLVLDRSEGGIDSSFSLEPDEFRKMIQETTLMHQALGRSGIGPSKQEVQEMKFRRSIFITQPISKGEVLTKENIKIVRPANGVCPSLWENILGRRSKKALKAGNPLLPGDWR